MKHEILDDLAWRYTTKKYDATKRISEQDLAIILASLHLSASSINAQPWKFVVLESIDAKKRFYDTFARLYQFNQPHALDASHIILFGHDPEYCREDYEAVIDQAIIDGRTTPAQKEGAFSAFHFAELNTDDTGSTEMWTKAQTYLALGNTLHTLARLKIDSTTMEGIDIDFVNEAFGGELDGHVCHVALAMGYRLENKDYNAALPKSRLPFETVITKI
jgi:nitroreductase/dihydropteridine reductase